MKLSYQIDDLIAAPATPRGRGALAVIRTSGSGCIRAVSQAFSRPEVLENSAGYRVHHGWIVDEGEKIDEVLITVFREPLSYTGQDVVEVSCHGGPSSVDRILEVLHRLGFRDAEPGEFTFRAFSLGKMDLTRAEAVKAIIDARTDRGRALAVSRLAGTVVRVIDEAKEVVKNQAAAAALALDYPEDETEALVFDADALRAARDRLEDLIATWRTGRLYQEGLTAVLIGPVNAGKSSLFNLFLREERSIVTANPGTTRDWVEALLNLDGIPVRLIDTAGLRQSTEDAVEQEGMRRSRNLAANADLVIAVTDGSNPSTAAPANGEGSGDAEWDGPVIRVWNKADIFPRAPGGYVPVSALTGAGFSDLEQAMRSHIGSPSVESGAPVIASVRQRDALEEAVAALNRFLTGMDADVPVDLLAQDLRAALDALGSITGEVTRADVLDRLFDGFCVGK